MDLVTGVSGQDGSYLAEHLLAAGRRVTGLLLPGEAAPAWLAPIQHQGLGLHACDLADPVAFRHLLRELKPERVYHCAALSVPAQAAADPAASRIVNVVSVEVLSEWLRRDAHGSRLLVVSSSAVFGPCQEGQPHNEDSPSQPQGEYARQKAEVRELARLARAAGAFCACAIPFNHESERRSDDFVLPKVCRAAARIAQGRQERLLIGATQPRRDWGHAPEYAQALQWLLDVPEPLELVLATGVAHSVDAMIDLAFGHAGVAREGRVAGEGSLLRAGEPDLSYGDARRAYRELGWEARVGLDQLTERLVAAFMRA